MARATTLTRLLQRLAHVDDGQLLLRIAQGLGVYVEERYAASIPDADSVHRPLEAFYTLNGKPSKFKSERQRRKVFALLAEGDIPYERDGALENSITAAVSLTEQHGATIRLTAGSPAAPFVLGENQSHYHAQSGWLTFEAFIDTNRALFKRFLVDELRKELQAL